MQTANVCLAAAPWTHEAYAPCTALTSSCLQDPTESPQVSESTCWLMSSINLYLYNVISSISIVLVYRGIA